MRVWKRRLAANTAYETSYTVIRGDKRGPVFIITAGIHGNEIASIRAANKLAAAFNKGHLRLKKGTLIIVPIVNRKAYAKRIRGVPDLNRTFPRSVPGLARHPLSAALFRLARRFRPSWYLDLHEANGLSRRNRRFLGQSLLTNPGSSSVPAVRRIVSVTNRSIRRTGRSFTIRLRELPGSSRTAAARLLHAKAVTVETSWDLPISDRVDYQTGIVRKFLREAGMV